MKHLATIALLAAAQPLGAHPHIFIDTGLSVIVDDTGRATHVKVVWKYDGLFSLLVTEDKQMDLDGDGALTTEEEAALSGFDMQWIEGFTGDLVASLDGEPLTLGGPEQATATMEDGQIITTHVRAIAQKPKLAGAALSLKPFDPTYYTAYDITGTLQVVGMEGCTITKAEPDIDSEMQKLSEQLAELGQDQDALEMGFPEVGEAFATDVRITCAGS